jgi:hypothetical protein
MGFFRGLYITFHYCLLFIELSHSVYHRILPILLCIQTLFITKYALLFCVPLTDGVTVRTSIKHEMRQYLHPVLLIRPFLNLEASEFWCKDLYAECLAISVNKIKHFTYIYNILYHRVYSRFQYIFKHRPSQSLYMLSRSQCRHNYCHDTHQKNFQFISTFWRSLHS